MGEKYGFCHFPKVASLVFLEIAQDCSLGQCLISSKAGTSKKKKKQKKKRKTNWGQNYILNNNVVQHLLKLAYCRLCLTFVVVSFPSLSFKNSRDT